jgi:hypothetical protein
MRARRGICVNDLFFLTVLVRRYPLFSLDRPSFGIKALMDLTQSAVASFRAIDSQAWDCLECHPIRTRVVTEAYFDVANRMW